MKTHKKRVILEFDASFRDDCAEPFTAFMLENKDKFAITIADKFEIIPEGDVYLKFEDQ